MLIIPSIHTGVLVVGTGARTHTLTHTVLSISGYWGKKKKKHSIKLLYPKESDSINEAYL